MWRNLSSRPRSSPRAEYVGAIMNLCIEKRGVLGNQVYLTSDRVELSFSMPLGEIVFDFYDKLKSVSRGYASFDYFPDEYKPVQAGQVGHSHQRRPGGRLVSTGAPVQCL